MIAALIIFGSFSVASNQQQRFDPDPARDRRLSCVIGYVSAAFHCAGAALILFGLSQ